MYQPLPPLTPLPFDLLPLQNTFDLDIPLPDELKDLYDSSVASAYAAKIAHAAAKAAAIALEFDVANTIVTETNVKGLDVHTADLNSSCVDCGLLDHGLMDASEDPLDFDLACLPIATPDDGSDLLDFAYKSVSIPLSRHTTTHGCDFKGKVLVAPHVWMILEPGLREKNGRLSFFYHTKDCKMQMAIRICNLYQFRLKVMSDRDVDISEYFKMSIIPDTAESRLPCAYTKLNRVAINGSFKVMLQLNGSTLQKKRKYGSIVYNSGDTKYIYIFIYVNGVHYAKLKVHWLTRENTGMTKKRRRQTILTNIMTMLTDAHETRNWSLVENAIAHMSYVQ